MYDLLTEDLKRDEAWRQFAYDDATGRTLTKGDALKGQLTIGVGRNLSANGLRSGEIDLLLRNDILAVFSELDKHVPWWRGLPDGAMRGLANMCFNLGWPRLSRFKNMLAALEKRDYRRASKEALDSKWARQVGVRAQRIARLYLNCG